MVILLVVLPILIIAGVFGFFFYIAFVRNDKVSPEDLEDKENAFLLPYKKIVQDGMDYINNFSSKRVYIKSYDGLRLSARYFEVEESRKTILLFHGYRSSATRDMSCAVKMYNEMGLNVLLADQRSHGESEGRLITFGVKERYDVLSWVDFCLKEYGEKEIIISGLSMGATTVLLAAGLELPQNVKAVIADCGFTAPCDIIRKVSKQYFHINGFVAIPIMNFLCLLFGKFSIYGVSTVDAMKKSRLPVFFIHGKKDNFVPYQMSEEAYNAAVGKKKMVLVDQADHGMSFLLEGKQIRKKLEKFINENTNS